MDRENENIIVLFANVSESNHLYESMGDIAATDTIKKCISIMQEVTQSQMGDVVNTISDKVNCIFWDANEALLAAKGMNEAIEEYVNSIADGGIPVNLHIGIHSGPVQKEGSRLFGDTVNMVARVTKLAKPREILITDKVFDALNATLKDSAQHTATITEIGSDSPVNLYEYIWEDCDMTVAIDRNQFIKLNAVQRTCLELTVQNQIYETSCHVPRLKLGRQSQNDIVIREKAVSRFHAYIELKDNKIVLNDQSTNGTFVYPQEGKPYCVKQMESYLEGTGVLCLGEDGGLSSPFAISYRIKNGT